MYIISFFLFQISEEYKGSVKLPGFGFPTSEWR